MHEKVGNSDNKIQWRHKSTLSRLPNNWVQWARHEYRQHVINITTSSTWYNAVHEFCNVNVSALQQSTLMYALNSKLDNITARNKALKQVPDTAHLKCILKWLIPIIPGKDPDCPKIQTLKNIFNIESAKKFSRIL